MQESGYLLGDFIVPRIIAVLGVRLKLGKEFMGFDTSRGMNVEEKWYTLKG